MRSANDSSDGRRTAAIVLARVDAAGAYAARLLTDAAPVVRELVLGTLRWQLTIDDLLAPLLRRPLAELDAPVRAILRLGTYEVHRLRTPRPVAVAEAVRVAKALVPAAAGLVNAVLRRVCESRWPDPHDATVPLHVRYAHPPWLVERWQERLGRQLEEALAVAQEPAPLALLAAVCSRDELEGAGCQLAEHPSVSGVLLVQGGAAAAVAALRAGRAYAMDPTAVLVARLLPEVDGLVMDLAAAPGGKSLILAVERPATLRLACDRHLGRVALLRRTLALATHPPFIAAADGTETPLRPGSCAAVLLDAPCSGTGTLRRHPEIRWRLRPDDLVAAAAHQRRLLAAAAALLRPAGYLLYATCSLEPEENEEVVASVPLTTVDLAGALPAGVVALPTSLGGVIVPPSAGGDGFTIHLLRRPA